MILLICIFSIYLILNDTCFFFLSGLKLNFYQLNYIKTYDCHCWPVQGKIRLEEKEIWLCSKPVFLYFCLVKLSFVLDLYGWPCLSLYTL